jgi:REP element-mobilizing transposase RayT
MNRGARKQAIFLTEEDRLKFLDLLSVANLRFGVEVNAYALMGNHYHVLVRTPDASLSRAFHYIDSVFAQSFNRHHQLDGPLFRGRFLSRLVDSDGYLHRVARYVHRNPVEAGLVHCPEDWKWSSYPFFLSSSRLPAWLFRDALRLSGLETSAQLADFTRMDNDLSDLSPADASPRILGSEAFIKKHLDRLDVKFEQEPDLRRARVRPGSGEVIAAVAASFRLRPDEITTTSQGRSNPARMVAAALCQEASGLTLQEVADIFGFRTPSSAGVSVSRFRQLASDHPVRCKADKLHRILDEANERLVS